MIRRILPRLKGFPTFQPRHTFILEKDINAIMDHHPKTLYGRMKMFGHILSLMAKEAYGSVKSDYRTWRDIKARPKD